MGNYQCSADNNTFNAALQNQNITSTLNLPLITYEGVLNENFYSISNQKLENYIDMDLQFAKTDKIFKSNNQLWVSCILKCMKDGMPRDEIPTDIAIVLDISGSMSSQLNYSNDKEQQQPKLDLAKKAICDLLEKNLKSYDNFGLATFDTQSKIYQEMESLKNLDLEVLKDMVQNDIQLGGGTCVKEGLQAGLKIINDFNNKNNNVKNYQSRQQRIIFLTDMQDMGAIEMEQSIKDASDKGIFVSFVGVGVDFDNKVTDILAKNKGCNYLSITKNDEMQDQIVNKFDYNFFPAAYNVDLKLQTEDYKIQEVYGTPFETKKNEDLSDELKQFQSVTEINTLFPSFKDDNTQVTTMQGGLILIKLKANKPINDVKQLEGKIKFSVSFTKNHQKDSQFYEIQKVIDLMQESQDELQVDGQYFSDKNIMKGILLQKYTEICQNFRKKEYIDEYDIKSTQQLFDAYENDLNQYINNYFEESDDIHKIKEYFQSYKNIVYKYKEQQQQQQQQQLQQ